MSTVTTCVGVQVYSDGTRKCSIIHLIYPRSCRRVHCPCIRYASKAELSSNLQQLYAADGLAEPWELPINDEGVSKSTTGWGAEEKVGAGGGEAAGASAAGAKVGASAADPEAASWWDSDNFFPRSFSLRVEREAFVQEFKVGHCVALLRCFTRIGSNAVPPAKPATPTIPLGSVQTAIVVLERRLAWSEGEPESGPSSAVAEDIGETHYTVVRDVEWAAVQHVDVHRLAGEYALGRGEVRKWDLDDDGSARSDRVGTVPLPGRVPAPASPASEEDVGEAVPSLTIEPELMRKAVDVLSRLEAGDPQIKSLYGPRNLWAVKPQAGSRSEGIFLSNRFVV